MENGICNCGLKVLEKKIEAYPLHAIGTTDQHSQLQLYLDGPKDKFFTFIKSNYKIKVLKIDAEIMKEESVNYFFELIKQWVI